MVKTDTAFYVRAIELMVKDAFPGRKVEVVVESSVFRPDVVAVKVFVDGFYGAYVTVPVDEPVYEQEIASALIDLIQDRTRKAEAEYEKDISVPEKTD